MADPVDPGMMMTDVVDVVDHLVLVVFEAAIEIGLLVVMIGGIDEDLVMIIRIGMVVDEMVDGIDEVVDEGICELGGRFWCLIWTIGSLGWI